MEDDDNDVDAYVQIQYYEIILIYCFTFTGEHSPPRNNSVTCLLGNETVISGF
jgi:hypothetical protein